MELDVVEDKHKQTILVNSTCFHHSTSPSASQLSNATPPSYNSSQTPVDCGNSSVAEKTLEETVPVGDAESCTDMAVTGDESETGSTGSMNACNMHKSSCSSPLGSMMAGSNSSQESAEEVLRKRELRLLKNREAARECRRKKKEYVKCLENRVAVLENQNKTLIEELKALKDIYGQKVE
ncbi:cAMP-responsive element modulator-like [Thalassophryne amazonica]|uniref:cAMP-responsive element modulator-like n=1 Tax=Thalassophryne amazonica TaxID=390379 RepID=UPI0014724EEA|nr:cAMP-responsive element modulator-like [Thalassophryne amazonica]